MRAMICSLVMVMIFSAASVRGDSSIPDATQPLPPGVGRLGYFAQKIRDKKPVTIGFLGGSITQGTGASSFRNAYWWLTRQALEKAISRRGDKSKYILAAVGGTNSVYGAYRVGVQLLDKNIDLLVVEFAVNDNPGGQRAVDGMEGIVRQAWKRNPHMGIIFLYTTSAAYLHDYYDLNKLPPSVIAHHAVAERYGIAEVQCGPQVRAGIEAGKFTTATFFKDGVHPMDVGHALYADLLSHAILSALDWPAPQQLPELPKPLGNGQLQFARMVSLDDAKRTGEWTHVKPGYYTYLGSWQSDASGAKIEIPVSGASVGLLIVGSTRIRYSGAGYATTEVNVPGRKFGIPTSFMLPERKTSDAAVLTIEPLPVGDKTAHIDITAVLLSAPE